MSASFIAQRLAKVKASPTMGITKLALELKAQGKDMVRAIGSTCSVMSTPT